MPSRKAQRLRRHRHIRSVDAESHRPGKTPGGLAVERGVVHAVLRAARAREQCAVGALVVLQPSGQRSGGTRAAEHGRVVEAPLRPAGTGEAASVRASVRFERPWQRGLPSAVGRRVVPAALRPALARERGAVRASVRFERPWQRGLPSAAGRRVVPASLGPASAHERGAVRTGMLLLGAERRLLSGRLVVRHVLLLGIGFGRLYWCDGGSAAPVIGPLLRALCFDRGAAGAGSLFFTLGEDSPRSCGRGPSAGLSVLAPQATRKQLVPLPPHHASSARPR